uniref:Chromo domain-containing protein n=1 Tax=Triticum urartu TaxID=4572 RepID=A0A8R7R519_TRIUA
MVYKLALPEDRRIHPGFHVSQLKPFTPDYSPVFSELPRTLDLTAAPLQPITILARRLVKKGNSSVLQVQVQWSSLSPDSATWEDYSVLHHRYPTAPCWNETTLPLKEGRMSHLMWVHQWT